MDIISVGIHHIVGMNDVERFSIPSTPFPPLVCNHSFPVQQAEEVPGLVYNRVDVEDSSREPIHLYFEAVAVAKRND